MDMGILQTTEKDTGRYKATGVENKNLNSNIYYTHITPGSVVVVWT